MKLHVLGVCGTFMGGVATLARDDGHQVKGSDRNVYPPMSTLLEAEGIEVLSGYEPGHLEPPPDLVVVGNALSRGNAAVEHMLNAGLPYVSGPQWLGENFLRQRRVLAVAGTHGKTTTTSMLAWILDQSGADPGFLIGGVAPGFGRSARAGSGEAFVVEADEYDTAFFDKRSKFVHYRPNVAVLNNLEFDHADIFPNLAAIETQFHHFIRTIPGNGTVVCNGDDANLARVLKRGCWTPVETFGLSANARWRGRRYGNGHQASVSRDGEVVCEFALGLPGDHNLTNAVAAIAAAHAVGVDPEAAAQALGVFGGVKRRLERIPTAADITIYDDFAHHPTAIEATINAVRDAESPGRVLVALEPRSNSMRSGAHAAALPQALANADYAAVVVREDWGWDTAGFSSSLHVRHDIVPNVDDLIARLLEQVRDGDRVVFMSNGGFDDAPRRFARALDVGAP